MYSAVDDLQDPGEYEQTSIRYTGKNIPSKSFRMLQSMTGGAGSASPPPGISPILCSLSKNLQTHMQ